LEAMLAVLATTNDPNNPDLELVAAYLKFYADDALVQPQGVAHNYDGVMDAPKHLTSRVLKNQAF
jgi:hypothetical protein